MRRVYTFRPTTACAFPTLANLAYFGIEFAVATAIGSVSLFADSVGNFAAASITVDGVIGRSGDALSGLVALSRHETEHSARP